MTAPSNRLLIWTAGLAVPLALASAAFPAWTLPCLAVFLLAALVAILDLLGAVRRPPPITVVLPEVTRYSRGREGVFTASLVQDETARRPHSLRIGLPFPPAIQTETPVQQLRLPRESGAYPVQWPCTPYQRGHFHLEGAYIAWASRLGLWQVRRRFDARAEIRVYPNLIQERNRMASLFLNRDGAGIHAQRQVGKGREFEQLRDYQPGDSYEDIHWKATARRGYPVTKTYQIERTQEIYVVVDASRLSARPLPGGAPDDPPEPQLEHLLRAALLLGLVAEKQGDFFGLATFSNRVHTFIRASKGRGHFTRCREALCTLQPRLVNPDFEEICTFIRLRLRRRALVLFLTNLDDPVLAESLARNLDLLANRHLVLVNMITADHVQPVFSRGPVGNVDEIYAHLGGHLQWQSLRETQRALQRRGVDMHLTGHENLCGDLVSQYVNVKQRQLL